MRAWRALVPALGLAACVSAVDPAISQDLANQLFGAATRGTARRNWLT